MTDRPREMTRPPRPPRDEAEANDPDSEEAQIVGLDYSEALKRGDRPRMAEIRRRWAAWPGVLQFLDELVDAEIEDRS